MQAHFISIKTVTNYLAKVSEFIHEKLYGKGERRVREIAEAMKPVPEDELNFPYEFARKMRVALEDRKRIVALENDKKNLEEISKF